MKNDINLFSDKDLEDFKQWAQEKRDYYQSIIDKIEKRIQSSGQGSFHVPVRDSNSHASVKKVHEVMNEAGKWLSNRQIRKLLEDKTGIKLTGNALRAHLREGENRFFERRGKARYTEWRAKKTVE